MAAKSKKELLSITEREFVKLDKLIASIGSDQALIKDDDDISIKDVVAHRAHWIELFLGWHRDGLAGKKVHFPAKGYKWNQLKQYNADLRDQQSILGWDDARELLASRHIDLKSFLKDLNDDKLYGSPMKGANNTWTPGRWAEAAGPSHYRSASKYVRSRLKSLSE